MMTAAATKSASSGYETDTQGCTRGPNPYRALLCLHVNLVDWDRLLLRIHAGLLGLMPDYEPLSRVACGLLLGGKNGREEDD
jgi:hypothetical protein